MFITRKHLSRRTVLKGAGATLALPLLEAMIPAATANALQAATPLRVGFVYIPHGAIMSRDIPLAGLTGGGGVNDSSDRWTPRGTGANFTLAHDLAPLEPYRSHLTVVSNLDNSWASTNSPHGVTAGTWLTSTQPVAGLIAYPDRLSLEQRVAEFRRDLDGSPPPIRSLEFATEFYRLNRGDARFPGFHHAIAHSRTQALLPEYDPVAVFRRLFGLGQTPDDRQRQLQGQLSMLDSLMEEIASLQRQLGPADQTTIAHFLDSVRETEQRLQWMQARQHSVNLAAPLTIPDAFEEHAKLMFDIMAIAYQTSLTYAITFMMNQEMSMRSFPSIGIHEPWHTLSHRSGTADRILRGNVVRLHTDLFAGFIRRLAETPDGDGTLLDHALIVYGSNNNDSNQHNFGPLPIAVLGRAHGAIRGNQHLIYPQHTPLNNLWLTLLNRSGGQAESLGNSTGELHEV